MSKLYSGAEIVFKCLEDQDVEFIFGYPGGAVLPIYDELKHHETIKHILVRHEQGAGHAAEGYARSSGKPGVVLVTSGPGATNVVTALTDAYMDSVPLVCISGQVPTHLIGTDAFQECDTTGITRPCTKHNWLVKDVNDLAEIIKKTKTQRSKRIHPATKTFQALRIFLNDEINNLKIGLEKSKDLIKTGGRIVCISFHSLEDRAVKKLFAPKKISYPKEVPLNNEVIREFRVVAKKIKPKSSELEINKRSRSAIMRVFEKI